MLTAKGQREDREDALAAGADMFISKPFSNAELVEAVGELANGRAN
jgi:DNA-binding response OmpR family regulator